MKKLSLWGLAVVAAVGLCAGGAAQAKDGEQIVFTPETIQWGPGPASLPAGAQMAVLDGDPTKPGPFTLRLKFPANYKVSPHWHPADEHVTVIAGTLHLALGDKVGAPQEEKVLPAGSFRVMPAKAHHFGWTAEEGTILQLHGMGPWEINYLDSSDDPRISKK